MARRIDEGDLRAERRGDLIGADMLGDAARLSARHVGGPDSVEQRGLAVVDMAHNGHDRRPRIQHGRIVGLIEQAFFNVRFGDASHGVAKFLGDQLGRVGVDRIGDLGDLALLHQELDHVDRAFGHAVGKLLDGNRLRDRNFPQQFFLRLIGGVTLESLLAAAKRGDRALTLLIGRQRGHYREPPAAPLRSASSWLRGRYRSGGACAPTCRTRCLLVLGFLDDMARRGRRGRRAGRWRGSLWLRFVFAETLLGFSLGLALSFFVVAATFVLFALSRLRSLAFDPVGGFPFLTPTGRLFGKAPLLGLADLRFRKGMGASRALFLGELAQDDTRWLATSRAWCRPGCGARSSSASRSSPPRHGHRGRRGWRSLCAFAIARTDRPPPHFFDHDLFRAAMAEALAYHPLLDAALERQCLGWGDRQGLLAGILGFSHYDPGSGMVPFCCREPWYRLPG